MTSFIMFSGPTMSLSITAEVWADSNVRAIDLISRFFYANSFFRTYVLHLICTRCIVHFCVQQAPEIP